MKRTVSAIFVFVMAAAAAKLPEAIDGRRMLEDVKTLAGERYKGRFTGTKELDQAAKWIAKNFERAGLRPPFTESAGKAQFLQKLEVSTDSRLGGQNRLKVAGRELKVGKDYVPRVFSGSGSVSAQMVFAGYGITAKEYHYDDYAGLDVQGKVVVVLRYEPQDQDEKSIFQGRNRTRHAGLETKAINAKLHGAVAMILLNNAVTFPEEAEKLDAFGGEAGVAPEARIPVLQVKASLAGSWFSEAKRDLPGIVKAIDKMLEPQSFRFPEAMQAEMRVEVRRVMRPTYNVAGYLAGETNEYLVIGAHYDHLGFGRQYSMAPEAKGKVHPGADDNGSGTAAVMELARYFGGAPKLRRGILFVAFTGEEIGLLGSSYLAGKMPLPLERCVAMINMDMVGRMVDGKFHVAGVATGSTFRRLLEAVIQNDEGLKPDYGETLSIGGSDHTSFAAKNVPTLFFFSGLHPDYHKPSDTWDKIEPVSYGRLIRVVAGAAEELARGEQRPEFRKVESGPAPGGGSGGGGGYGPYFGSVPDFAEVPGGVKLADVRAGSPAAKAGIQGGDILVEFDGKPVTNLQEYTYILRQKAAGDAVEVKVKRLSATLTFRVVLEARK
ncbi:MAG: M28 family peptidase [Bryobacter sp.]|nr:M28 family peptidase [Bryobacter sp. CoA8 C33]